MQCDWASITSSAYMTLLELNLKEFPIPLDKIKCKGVRISSLQNYAAKTGLSMEEISCGHELDDAFLLKEIRPGVNMILYNKDKFDKRVRHSLLHEVGHFKCGHMKHGEQEEVEAHFFAAQANAPNVLIKAITQRGHQVNKAVLMGCFGLSDESANKKMEYLQKYGFNHANEFDDVVLAQFSGFIDATYPNRNRHFYDEYYDERDKEREQWY